MFSGTAVAPKRAVFGLGGVRGGDGVPVRVRGPRREEPAGPPPGRVPVRGHWGVSARETAERLGLSFVLKNSCAAAMGCWAVHPLDVLTYLCVGVHSQRFDVR